MDSLTTGAAATVLERLYREAEAADAPLMAQFSTGATAEQMVASIIAAEGDDLHGLYRQHADHFLSVSPTLGRFLYMIARACGAQRIVEFGTSMGVSTIHLAAALRDMGGGQLIGSELEPTKAERATRNLEAAELAHLVEIRVGDARETLRALDGDVDLVLLDGAFTLYLPVLKVLEPYLKAGAVIIGENAFEQAGGYIAYVREPANGYLSQPLSVDAGRGTEFTVVTR
jgi:predicted O-methyltransferase YrrM